MNDITQTANEIEDFTDFQNYSEGPTTDSNDFICDDVIQLQFFHTILLPLIYSAVFLFGITGNGLLLTVLLKRRDPLRITEIYLLHLAVSDLLLLVTFPFAVIQGLNSWVFGDFLCKLVGLLNRINFLCGSLLLACIGIDRYLAIVHAVTSLQSRRPRTVHQTCAVLWLISLVVSVPHMAFLGVTKSFNDPNRLVCTFHNHGLHANNWNLANRLITLMLGFLLPLVIMIYCYTAVVSTLCRSQRGLEKQGAIRLALLVTMVFCLCWLPYNLAIMVDTLVVLGILPEQSCWARARLAEGVSVTESIGYTHSFLNPILYAFVGVRFRADLLRLLYRSGCGQVCAPVLGGEGFNRVSVSEMATTTTTTTI
ncbi:C-X-C chemokine receptor type 5 [Chanos chanos]|uniref:C-X-C chemokine receptor type 5 n=1 Tax=Chanos chanos TaxID=29144 RepID=A0A6J2UPS6_CHACN|nr:C-X-C chemokine receptor type 5 [Chanos chanos]